MNIVVICPTLNEERNIAQFCDGYSFADHILITDASTDRTAEIAGRYSNVQIVDVSHLRMRAARTYEGALADMPEVPNDFYTTPEPQQINMLISWARELGADWIIKDDADCWPNPALKRQARAVIESTSESMIMAYRLYIWGRNEYFPKANGPGQSLWAWQPDKVELSADESNPFGSGFKGKLPDDATRRYLAAPPLVLLHFFCPDEAAVQEKMIKKAARNIPWVHPLKSIYAPPEPLPIWVYGCLRKRIK